MSDNRIRLLAGHIMGMIVVSGLLVVIAKIAIGHVEEASSYGLMPLVVALSNLCTLYGTWAWYTAKDAKSSKEEEVSKPAP